MSKMSIGTIFLNENQWSFAIHLKNEAKHKNFSQTIDVILQHYQNILENNQQKVLRIQQLIKENTELKDIVANYRKTIINPE